MSTVESVWGNCLSIIKDIVNWQEFRTWFEPIVPISIKDKTILIQVPSEFFYEYLETHYVSLLQKTLNRTVGQGAKLEYRIMVDSGQGTTGGTVDYKSENRTSNKQPAGFSNGLNFPRKLSEAKINPLIAPIIKDFQINSQLNPSYTFDIFIEGRCNSIARRAGLDIARKPGNNAFNPLVIYGGTGLGKTHLVHAIGNEAKRLNPNKVVLYVSSEKFINQFIHHSRNGEINDFINFYQMIDILILDDVQYFASADKSQDAFFAIFNHLQQSGKQIILTSDKAPKDLEGLHERLLSRFKWGLSADIQIPEIEVRVEILRQKMQRDGVLIPDNVLQFVATNVTTNIRELEGAFLSLLAQSSLNKRQIDLDIAKKVLRDIVKSHSKEITIELIQKIVGEYFDVSTDAILSKVRKREIVQARQIAMYLSKNFTKNSLKLIGEKFGGRDHTTVIHSCQQVKDLMDTDAFFKENVVELTQKVQLAVH